MGACCGKGRAGSAGPHIELREGAVPHDADATRNPLGAVAKQAEAAAGAGERRSSHQREVEAKAEAGAHSLSTLSDRYGALDFGAVDAADAAAPPASSHAQMRRSLQLGVTLEGVRAFAALHWDDALRDPPCVRGERVPADEAARTRLVARLRQAGHTNTWEGDCPVLRVLEKQSGAARGGGAEPLADLVRRETAMNGYMNQLAIYRVCPEGRSWCEVLEAQRSAHVGKANVFVSWALSQGIDALADALERWLERHADRHDAGSTFFWICDFSIRQKPKDVCGADVAHLGDIVREIGHTALFLDPWDAPQPLARAWCLWELYHTVDCGARLDVVMSDEQRRRFRRALMNEDGGDGLESITRAVTSIDVERAETRKAKDRDMIMDAVRGSVGFYELNKLLMARMRAWVVEAARAEIAALPAAERGQEEEGALMLMHQVGFLLYNQGKYDEAEPLWREALAGKRATLGDTHPSTLTSINNLGNLLQAQGKRDEAEPLLREARAAR